MPTEPLEEQRICSCSSSGNTISNANSSAGDGKPRIPRRRLSAARMCLAQSLSELDEVLQHLRASNALRVLQQIEFHDQGYGDDAGGQIICSTSSTTTSPPRSPRSTNDWTSGWGKNTKDLKCTCGLLRQSLDEVQLRAIAMANSIDDALMRPPTSSRRYNSKASVAGFSADTNAASRSSSLSLLLSSPSTAMESQDEEPPPSSTVFRLRDHTVSEPASNRAQGLQSSSNRQEAPAASINAADDSFANQDEYATAVDGSAEYRSESNKVNRQMGGHGSVSDVQQRKSTLKFARSARQNSAARVAFSPQTETRHFSDDEEDALLHEADERRASQFQASSESSSSSMDETRDRSRNSSAAMASSSAVAARKSSASSSMAPEDPQVARNSRKSNTALSSSSPARKSSAGNASMKLDPQELESRSRQSSIDAVMPSSSARKSSVTSSMANPFMGLDSQEFEARNRQPSTATMPTSSARKSSAAASSSTELNPTLRAARNRKSSAAVSSSSARKNSASMAEDPVQEARSRKSMDSTSVVFSSPARRSSSEQVVQEMPRRSSREEEAQFYSLSYAQSQAGSMGQNLQTVAIAGNNVVEPAAAAAVSYYYSNGDFLQGSYPNTADAMLQYEAPGLDNSAVVMPSKRSGSKSRLSQAAAISAAIAQVNGSYYSPDYGQSDTRRKSSQSTSELPEARNSMYTRSSASTQQINPTYSQGDIGQQETPSRSRSGSPSSSRRSRSYSAPQSASYDAVGENQIVLTNAVSNGSTKSRAEQMQYESTPLVFAVNEGREPRLTVQGRPDMRQSAATAVSGPPVAAAAANANGRKSRYQDEEMQQAVMGVPPVAAAAANANGRNSRYQDEEAQQAFMGVPPVAAAAANANGRKSRYQDEEAQQVFMGVPPVAAAANGRKSRYKDEAAQQAFMGGAADGRRSQIVGFQGGEYSEGPQQQVMSMDVAAGAGRSQFTGFGGDAPNIPAPEVRNSRLSNGARKSRFAFGEDQQQDALGRMNDGTEGSVVYGDVEPQVSPVTAAAGRKSRSVAQGNDPPEYRRSNRSSRSLGSSPSRKSRVNGEQRNSVQALQVEAMVVQGMGDNQAGDPAAMAWSEAKPSSFVSREEDPTVVPFSTTEGRRSRYVEMSETSIPATAEAEETWVYAGEEADYYDEEAMEEWQSRLVSRSAETDEAWMDGGEMERRSTTLVSARNSSSFGRGSSRRFSTNSGIPPEKPYEQNVEDAQQQQRRDSAPVAAIASSAMAMPSMEASWMRDSEMDQNRTSLQPSMAVNRADTTDEWQ